MRERKSRRAHGNLSRGALLSLLAHAHLLVPLMLAAWIYGARQEAERPEEVDVAFESVAPEDLPADLPSLDALEPDQQKRDKDKDKTKDRQKAKDALAAKDKQPEDKKPEPEIAVPQELPPMPEPPAPPPPERRDHEKMVDLDNDKEVEPPPDAKYLAQKNNRALEETRATDTNLEKASKGEQAPSAPSERPQDDPEVGGEKAKIAELDEQKSKLGRKAPDVTPHAEAQLAETPVQPREKSLLALRDPAPRSHELTPETADPSLPRAADGALAAPQKVVRGKTSDATPGDAKRVKLALSGKDYEYLFGAEADAERRLAQKQRSMKVGKFQQKQARIRAALENFIPEVKPGNQTALNTRAAPFAAYIARMHRSIHALWGFGQLEDWDEKSGSSPFNNPNLLTTLELVLNGDGTVDKITIVRASGLLEYDVAVMDVAYSAGPYPDPPREIRSANGKIYIHWRFYRDGRQCATSGVDYFILNNPPANGDKPAVAELPAASRAQAPRPIGAAGEGEGDGAGPRRLSRAEPVASRHSHAGHTHAANEGAGAGASEGGGGGGAAAEASRPPRPAPAPAATAAPRSDNPLARAVAERFFAALAKGNAGGMADTAAYPFKSTGGAVIKSREQLVAMLQDLASEGSARRAGGLQIFTAAGARGAIGRLPPGLDDGTGTLFAVSAVSDHDALILVLGLRPGGWKAVGLVRR